MTMRVHIERLVVDRRVLARGQVPHFQAALTAAMARLHTRNDAPPPRDAIGRLAERTAQAIMREMAPR